MRYATALDLCDLIVSTIGKAPNHRLPRALVSELLTVLYAVSLSVDEGATPLCDVVWLDPERPDPSPPPYIRCDRWKFIKLENPVPLNVRELTKISRASDPRSSWLVVYPKRRSRQLFIWGLIDQAGSNFVGMRTFDSDTGYPPPGLFQVSVTGLARLEAFDGLYRIGTLHNQELIREQFDALWSTSFLNAITPTLKFLAPRIWTASKSSASDDDFGAAAQVCVESISRILRHIQSFRHGGAILITPHRRHLRIKYKLTYPRLRDALEHIIIRQLKDSSAKATLVKSHEKQEELAVEAVMKTSIASSEVEDAKKELDGAEWFISLLTRVDGAVVITPNLVVEGYGAEITTTPAPKQLWLARDTEGSHRKTKRANYEHFGTRHRSAMRFCSAVPNAVAIVVSQDGDVRMIANVSNKITVWENVKLGYAEFVR